jgi:two-component system, OmpR family, sensor histidine kinase KdpD
VPLMGERPPLRLPPVTRMIPASLVWAVTWIAMIGLDHRVDLANLAMLLVLASAIATLWLPIGASLLCTALSVLAFNWLFVPPRHAFSVDLRQDALLLGAMLAVSWIVAAVVARQRVLAESARRHAQRAEQLRGLGEALRDADDAAQSSLVLRTVLAELLGVPPKMLLLRDTLPPDDDAAATVLIGEPTPHELTGMWHCVRQARPFGPGTGHHAELQEWYLPLRARHAAFGAVSVALDSDPPDDTLRLQAQALCDQLGTFLQRTQTQRAAHAARDHAQAQGIRNALLAAISHDYRTPLAAIMGAASSLCEQGDRLATGQRQRLAQSIVDQTMQLSRLTENTLQLARLDGSGVQLRLDWESAEEIVGTALRHARSRDSQRRVRARLEPAVPLVRCDALLLSQLLDNLVDNALKYSAAPTPVELLVRRQSGCVVFAVRDRGPGVEPAWRERIFEVYQRGEHRAHDSDGSGALARRGAGVGLAVCRAIARAHGGELKLRVRAHGGASFECWLPEAVPPSVEPDEGRPGTA